MKKLTALFLVLALALSLCAFTATAEEEPFVITVVCPSYNETDPKDTTGAEGNPVLEAIEELCNVDLQITWAPQGDYATKFNTTMVSKDVPMVMVVTSGLTTNANYIEMCENGVFWDLSDKIQANAFLRDNLTSPAALTVTAVNGRNYLFPAIISAARVGVLYREDWLKKLDLKVPDTVDAFKAMVEAFTTKDPDGNGQNDTIGFAYCDNQDKELVYAGFNTLAVMMGAPNGWGIDAEGNQKPYFMFDEYMETLKLFNWMYVNGYMNTDFAINTDKHGPLLKGQSGSMITTATNMRYPGGKYDSLRDNIDTNARINAAQIMYKADGTPVINSVLSVGGMGGIVIPKLSVKDEATLDRILQFIEDLNDEGGIYLAVGVEGLHYERDAEGKIIVPISDEMTALRKADGSSEVFASMFPRRVQSLDYGQGLTSVQQITAVSIANEKYAVADTSVGYMDSELQSVQTQIATIISDARVKFIMGQLDEAGFKAEVQRWLSEGGQDIIDNVNANYKAAHQ